MINNIIKSDLDQLKNKVKHEINVNYEQSYNDVITSLINYYYKSKRIVYPLERKILAVIPLKPVSLSVSSKLENKTKASFLLES